MGFLPTPKIFSCNVNDDHVPHLTHAPHPQPSFHYNNTVCTNPHFVCFFSPAPCSFFVSRFLCVSCIQCFQQTKLVHKRSCTDVLALVMLFPSDMPPLPQPRVGSHTLKTGACFAHAGYVWFLVGFRIISHLRCSKKRRRS